MAKDNDLMWIETTATQLQQAKDRLAKQVDVYVANKDNSLEDRWNVWSKYGITNTGDWIEHFPEDRFPKFDDYMYGSHDYNRCQIIDYDDVLCNMQNMIHKQLFEDKWNLTDDEQQQVWNHPMYVDMQEYLMGNNLRSYKFDW